MGLKALAKLLWQRFSWRDVGLVAVVVAVAALFGILSRPIGFLSLFWPANAILLGLVVRQPRFASIWCWISATIAFLFADLITGDALVPTLWLTAANVVGAFCGWVAFTMFAESHRRLMHPLSILYMLAAALIASLAAGLVGCWAAPLLLEHDPLWGLGFWFASELVNYAVILPVALTIPGIIEMRRSLPAWRSIQLPELAPLLALVISVAIAHMVGGPGVIAIPVPALLWCALSYPLFPTAVFTAMLCTWQMVTIVDVLELRSEGLDPVHVTTSIRLGLALLALAPLTVASVNQARNELIARLGHAISHDNLTGTLARIAFVDRAEAVLARRRDVAVLMIDLDHFKKINDAFGHAVGDRALVAFADAAKMQLRPGDMLARIGGEEFAALVWGVDARSALQVAERLRAAIERTQMELENERPLTMTVSVGVAMAESGMTLDRMLSAADKALYGAKAAGRNRVALAPETGYPRPHPPSALPDPA